MKRVHLFEFEDLNWFPVFLRNYGTDFLQFISNKTKLYQPVLPLLEKTLVQSKTNQIIDLGSGGGGGLFWLNKELKKSIPHLKITLTDYFPNLTAYKLIRSKEPNFDFVSSPVDAKNVPKHLIGLRTQLLSFHHFKPTDAQQILQNAIDSNNSIAVLEAQERSFKSFFTLLFIFIPVLLMTPFIKPFSFKRLFFTYIIPIVPFFVTWDGLVSSLRTYSVAEMNKLVKSTNNHENFNWEIGKIRSFPTPIMYLIGAKK